MTTTHTPPSLADELNQLEEILGSRPILPTENSKAYDELTRKFRDAVLPQDIIEDILTRDAIDLTWEIQRLKDFKFQLTLYERAEHMKRVLDKLLGPFGYEPKIIEQFLVGNPLAVKTMKTELAKRGHNLSIFDAVTYQHHIDKIERIDRQILQAEARRAAHLKEVDRHRAVLAQQLREATWALEDNSAAEEVPQE